MTEFVVDVPCCDQMHGDLWHGSTHIVAWCKIHGNHPDYDHDRIARLAEGELIDARGLLMAEARRMWALAAATLERDIRLHDMTEDEERVMIGAVLNAAGRHYEAQSATIERMREAIHDEAVPTFAAIRAVAGSAEWNASAAHFREICRKTIEKLNASTKEGVSDGQG